jgi:Ca2+-binding RTX toxin-like protein
MRDGVVSRFIGLVISGVIVTLILQACGVIEVKAAEGASCRGVPATIVGTPTDARYPEGHDAPDDVIEGTPKADVIVAMGGDDVIWARGGNDVICGGPGTDDVFAGPGRDAVFTGSGNDSAEGNGGADYISLGRSSVNYTGPPEWLEPNYGFLGRCDIAHGDLRTYRPGDDRIVGGPGPDCFTSLGPGNDDYRGGPGTDVVYGGRGRDRCAAEERYGCE